MSKQLTEDDVRRICREEFAKIRAETRRQAAEAIKGVLSSRNRPTGRNA